MLERDRAYASRRKRIARVASQRTIRVYSSIRRCESRRAAASASGEIAEHNYNPKNAHDKVHTLQSAANAMERNRESVRVDGYAH